MSWICMQSFSFIPLRLFRRRFLNIFSKFYTLCWHGHQSNSAIFTKFIRIVEDYSRNISVKKILNMCSETAKIANFHFSHYKSMTTISFHSNQSSYPLGIKTQLLVPSAYRCYMWNLVRIGLMALEEMSFGNVDGRTTDACLYYKLTFGSGELTSGLVYTLCRSLRHKMHFKILLVIG